MKFLDGEEYTLKQVGMLVPRSWLTITIESFDLSQRNIKDSKG
jgi:hypothetical protein